MGRSSVVGRGRGRGGDRGVGLLSALLSQRASPLLFFLVVVVVVHARVGECACAEF